MEPKKIIGIDISDILVKNALKSIDATNRNLINFFVMDAENAGFRSSSFDVVYEKGTLRHLNLRNAYSELSRIGKPTGKVICIEALKYNPFIHLYRRLTPHLRTQWEVRHIFGKREIAVS